MQYQIQISIQQQQLTLKDKSSIVWQAPVSTALNGMGEQQNSGCTPLGQHRIRLKIGDTCPLNSVFVGRRFTGEIYTSELAKKYPDRDWILTRILWLTGCETGRNRFGHVDTLRRFIYIHGCPDSEPMGIPLSHGCVRMRNEHIKQLFEQVDVGMSVLIDV